MFHFGDHTPVFITQYEIVHNHANLGVLILQQEISDHISMGTVAVKSAKTCTCSGINMIGILLSI